MAEKIDARNPFLWYTEIMSNESSVTDFYQQPVRIGAHAGWDLHYCPWDNTFMASKGEKQRRENSRASVLRAVDDANAEELRKARRLTKCQFEHWDPATNQLTPVTLTSFSNRGVALKPADGSSTYYIERVRWNGQEKKILLVKKPGADLKRIDRAIEALRRAQQELKAAEQETFVAIEVKDPGYGAGLAEFHAEEDRIRAEVAKVTKETK